MERCALQGFRAEQLAGMSKAGVLRATGNAMSTPVVAAVFKRCMQVLIARFSAGVPSVVPQRDEVRAERGGHRLGDHGRVGRSPVSGPRRVPGTDILIAK